MYYKNDVLFSTQHNCPVVVVEALENDKYKVRSLSNNNVFEVYEVQLISAEEGIDRLQEGNSRNEKIIDLLKRYI